MRRWRQRRQTTNIFCWIQRPFFDAQKQQTLDTQFLQFILLVLHTNAPVAV